MSGKPGGPRVLHIHGSLATGDPQAERCVRLIEAFGARLRHTMVAADGDFGALAGLGKGLTVQRRTDFPRSEGVPLPGRMQAVARAMVDHNLVLTYGRVGAGAALAHTMFGEIVGAPPLIHHEDGSDETAKQRGTLRGKWLRRVGLGKASGLVVPSETMEGVALSDWQQPMGRVKLIPDCVDLALFAKPIKDDAIPRLRKQPGELWLVCFAGSGRDEHLAEIVAAVERLEAPWHLVIGGAPGNREALDQAIAKRLLDARVHFAPAGTRHSDLTRLADLVVLAGGREPLPLYAIDAMAAGKPLAGFHDGELAEFFAPDSADFIAPADARRGGDGVERLANDPYLREKVGAANREQALAERDEASMIATYRRLYSSAMGIEPF